MAWKFLAEMKYAGNNAMRAQKTKAFETKGAKLVDTCAGTDGAKDRVRSPLSMTRPQSESRQTSGEKRCQEVFSFQSRGRNEGRVGKSVENREGNDGREVP